MCLLVLSPLNGGKLMYVYLSCVKGEMRCSLCSERSQLGSFCRWVLQQDGASRGNARALMRLHREPQEWPLGDSYYDDYF